MKEYAENKRCESRTIQKSVKKQGVTSNVRQNVLFTDVPEGKDFRSVTDLGIWWGMAAEWNHQKTILKSDPKDPHKYIKSIKPYTNDPSKIPPIDVDSDDQVRMLSHGANPNELALENAYTQPVDANKTVENIQNNITNNEKLKKQVLPMFCFIGGNDRLKVQHTGLGKGPILCPSNRVMSFDLGKANTALDPKKFSYSNCAWKNIIDKDGGWKSIGAAAETNTDMKSAHDNYCSEVKANADSTKIDTALGVLLEMVYKLVADPYKEFADYLAGKALTGEASPLWTNKK